MIDFDNNKFSIYFNTQRLGIAAMIEAFAGIEVPPVFAGMFTYESTTVSYNPSGSPSSAVATVPPSSSSMVATSSADCENAFALMTFAPLPPGVSC